VLQNKDSVASFTPDITNFLIKEHFNINSFINNDQTISEWKEFSSKAVKDRDTDSKNIINTMETQLAKEFLALDESIKEKNPNTRKFFAKNLIGKYTYHNEELFSDSISTPVFKEILKYSNLELTLKFANNDSDEDDGEVKPSKIPDDKMSIIKETLLGKKDEFFKHIEYNTSGYDSVLTG
jgi:hypothetical protein